MGAGDRTARPSQSCLRSVAPESVRAPDARRCLAAYFDEARRALRRRVRRGRGARLGRGGFVAPHGVLFLARRDGEAVGCGGLVAIDAETAEVKRVWTSPAARALGVAKALLAAMETEARSRGFRRLRLDTNKTLAEAQAMYLKAGFRDIERYNDNPYAHRWFEKEI